MIILLAHSEMDQRIDYCLFVLISLSPGSNVIVSFYHIYLVMLLAWL